MDEFSNTDDDVFLVRTRRMIDRGALLSRYSRTATLDIRELYRKEFENDERRGTEFYKKVFIEYGDESVSELVTAQMAIQNVSNVVSKRIEEVRVGLSFLEKSSRYVRYDRKVDGKSLAELVGTYIFVLFGPGSIVAFIAAFNQTLKYVTFYSAPTLNYMSRCLRQSGKCTP